MARASYQAAGAQQPPARVLARAVASSLDAAGAQQDAAAVGATAAAGSGSPVQQADSAGCSSP